VVDEPGAPPRDGGETTDRGTTVDDSRDEGEEVHGEEGHGEEGQTPSAVPEPPRADEILVYNSGDLPDAQALVRLEGYQAQVPEQWPRRFESKENPREVTLFVDNWYANPVEVYQIDGDGHPVGRGHPETYSPFEISTRQGNVFVFFAADGTYFGEYTTTGEGEQRVRLIAPDGPSENRNDR